MPLSIGEEFAGYTVARQLGAGGMGEVYLAQHPRLPRQDALKILPPDFTDDSGFRQRFNREADLAATLWHPHIVGVHDRGEHHGQLWISMDFVDGTDAARLLQETDRHGLPVDDALEIVDALADALDYAHDKGLLHRDVKPANILIAAGEKGRRRILLTDFGIARQADEISGLTATNQTIGTVSYASPEQLTGAELDNRSDQYSLAVTAYELLTGTTPFEHSNPAVVIGQHLNNPPPPISSKRPEFAALDAVFAKALSKQPADRFATCRDFAAALRTAIQTTQAAVAQPASGGFAPVDTGSAVPNEATPDPSAAAFAPPYAAGSTESTKRLWTIGVPVVLAVLLTIVTAFAVFEATRSHDMPTPAPPWEPYVEAGKTAAVALTTINHQTVDQDVQRVLDLSTGQFHDDFANRAASFKQVVRDAQSASTGTVTGAGLETLDGDKAKVLVAVTVQTTNANAPQQEPRSWRMRVSVEKTGDTYKTSNVEFVP